MTQESVYDPEVLHDLLPVYYKRLFPFGPFYRWMSYGLSEPNIFINREFSFVLGNDIYIRYLSFENQIEFEKELTLRNPVKIDIGPVMNVKPKNHRSVLKMQPVQKELVFDIDMTDYDEVRTCCSGADVCLKCWKFMTIACKILDAALREDFGYENILWVFSGRRGIHCWVCDKSARHMNSKGRSGVAEYLSVIVSGGEGSTSKVTIGEKMHHSVRRAYQIIEPYFEEICIKDQNMFGTPEGIKMLLAYVPDENIKKEMTESFKRVEGDSNAVWKLFVKHVSSVKQGPYSRRFRFLIEEVQIMLLYPRLDINVSKGFNHLLKAPFCVHPKTGKICVPFNPNAAQKFDPTTVPTINLLLDEINTFDLKNTNEDAPQDKSNIRDYKKTKMLKGILVFEEFLRKLENSYKHSFTPNYNININF